MFWKQSQSYFQQAGRWLSLFQPGDPHFIFQTLKQPNSDISIQFSLLHTAGRVWQRTSITRRTFIQFGWLPRCLLLFLLRFIFLPPLFISHFSPLLVYFTSSFSSPANLFCPLFFLRVFRLFLPTDRCLSQGPLKSP